MNVDWNEQIILIFLFVFCLFMYREKTSLEEVHGKPLLGWRMICFGGASIPLILDASMLLRFNADAMPYLVGLPLGVSIISVIIGFTLMRSGSN